MSSNDCGFLAYGTLGSCLLLSMPLLPRPKHGSADNQYLLMMHRLHFVCRRIVVEDVQLPPSFAEEHKPPKGAVARRMVFLSNQGLVQSEALMAPLISRHTTASCSLA